MTAFGAASLPLPLPPLWTVAIVYATAEFLFFLLFHWYLFPRANRRKSPHYVEQYQDYDSRSKLLERIIDRLEQHCKREDSKSFFFFFFFVFFFLGNWFCVCGDVKNTSTSLRETSVSSSDTASTADCNEEDDDEWQTIDRLEKDGLLLPNGRASKSRSSSFLRRGDTDIFFAWAFFGKPLQSLEEWERAELAGMYTLIEQRIGLRFDQPGTTPGIKPMRLTLDDVRATYRPLLVYGMFYGLGVLARIILRCFGFQHYKSKSGLTYWHRKVSDETGNGDIPLLFNHGIAPGGLALYLPMILFGWGPLGRGNADRTLLLFENHPISFTPCFEAVTEDAYVAGVCEAIDLHLDRSQLEKRGIAIMGHSFGSCNVTWSIRCREIRRHVREVMLIDPVSIMLSEPDVMTNFLYAGRDTSTVSFSEALSPIFLFPFYYVMNLLRPADRSRVVAKRKSSSLFRSYSSYSAGQQEPQNSGSYNKIIMIQSELFIEHYLRRNFSWYNGELWLDDLDNLPRNAKIVIGVAEKDEILSASKVLAEAKRYKEKNKNLKIIHWPGAGHAYSVPRPWTWKQMQKAIAS